MQTFENSNEDKVGVFQIGLLFFTLIVLGAVTVDTILVLPQEVSTLIGWMDTMACAVFFADVCIRFRHAKSKWAFMKWGWIDLLACVPYVSGLRYGRVMRVLRVIRLLRAMRSVHRIIQLILERKVEAGVVSLPLAAVVLIMFSSIAILICERDGHGNIKTAEDAIWWSVSTVTTVGYGDMVPVTTEGRILAGTLMIAGVGMFGMWSALVASVLLGRSEQHATETQKIMDRLDVLQKQVAELSGTGSGQNVEAKRTVPHSAAFPVEEQSTADAK